MAELPAPNPTLWAVHTWHCWLLPSGLLALLCLTQYRALAPGVSNTLTPEVSSIFSLLHTSASSKKPS